MDTTAIISLIVVSLAIIIPIIYSSIRSEKKKQKSKAEFWALGKSRDMNISEYQKWNHYAIGIDKKSAKLMYLKTDISSYVPKIIDLSLVMSAEVLDSSRTVDTKSGRVTVLDQLMLKLTYKAKDSVPDILEFYNSETDATPHHETEIIAKWKKIIDFSLHSLKQNS
jgi:hypothetical protein